MDIDSEGDIWTVTISWSEVNDAYTSNQTPVERSLSAVADRHDIVQEQLQSSVIRASDDGMAVVVERDS